MPAAYKDIDEVMRNQRDLVEVVRTLMQMVYVKGWAASPRMTRRAAPRAAILCAAGRAPVNPPTRPAARAADCRRLPHDQPPLLG